MLECSSYCSLSDVCTAFHFDKPVNNCSLGSKESLIPADSSDSAQSIKVYVNPDGAKDGIFFHFFVFNNLL